MNPEIIIIVDLPWLPKYRFVFGKGFNMKLISLVNLLAPHWYDQYSWGYFPSNFFSEFTRYTDLELVNLVEFENHFQDDLK